MGKQLCPVVARHDMLQHIAAIQSDKVKNSGVCFLAPVGLGRLDALDPNAYEAFKASRNLQDVVERVLRNEQEVEKEPGQRRALSVQASLMTPVQPMLVRTFLLPCFLLLCEVTTLPL